ncbi:MAG: type I secretion C-terminal target domain-containing protein, partial [Verrucomicrobiales bacterium]
MTEPPAVLYGKVLQHGEGVAYQLFLGAMEVTLVNQADPENRVVLSTKLREVGGDGSFSYRLELPQKYLPSQQETDDYLEVDRVPTSYVIEVVTIDGEPAAPLDAARANLTTAFALRAGQHRLDLQVSLAESDADSDGMPDWWEDYYGLNRNSATDASGDLDGDGLTNLQEFQGGTDPLVANTVPLLRTRLLVFPAGGTAGLALSIVDVDSEPDAIELTITAAPDGLEFFRGSTALPSGKPFTYADVLAGRVTAEVDPSFGGATLELEIKDLGTGGVEALQVAVEASSPWAGGGPRPAVWLNADALNSGAVSEWGDMSGSGRDAFQPDAASQPVAGVGAVDFGGDAYLYLDMKELELGEFSAFAAFDLSKHDNDEQTLFRTSDVAMSVAGKKAGSRARSLLVEQADRTAVGPVVPTGILSQMSLVSDGARTFFNLDGTGHFPSAPADNSERLPHAFATLGGAQEIVDPTASARLDGALREFVLFDQALTPAQRTRNEDYQRSRYGDVLVWDYRAETAPIAITGSHSSQNAINGGWGGDQLTGGPLDDILRGGSGDDALEGGDGGDWFAFTEDEGGADTVVDFSIEDGDVIDLSDIFGGQEGDPAAYVYLRSEIELSAHEQPVVNTVLELNYDGDGEGVDQTVTLAGVALSNTGLVKLLASGSLVLGGPLYQTTVMLAAEETSFPAVPAPHEVMVSRSGEMDSEALEVPLTFGGTADIEVDFVVEGVGGEGPVRTVEFSPGETMKRFSVTPVAQPGVTGS